MSSELFDILVVLFSIPLGLFIAVAAILIIEFFGKIF